MLAITHGNILTMIAENLARGTILIDQGKIVDLGENIAIPAHAKEINAQGKVIMPGLIDAHCHLGLAEEIYQLEGDDVNEMTNPVTPHLRAVDGINPEDLAFGDALRAGVTTVAVAPGSGNVIGGQVVVLKTWGRIVDEMVLKEPAALKIALGENPKRIYGKEKKTPQTRMATAALLREYFVQGQNYLQEEKPRDLLLEPGGQVIKNKIPLHAHTHRGDDMMTALRIAEEFGLPLVLIHGTDGHKFPHELAERKIAVVSGPHLVNRAKVEMKDKTWETPGILAAAGVPVAIMTDHPVVPIQYLSLCATLAHRAGMSAEEALKAITIRPAEILGIAQRVGSLEVGKDADLLILNGSILDLESTLEKVLVNGMVVYEA